MVVSVIVGFTVNLDYYALSPGNALAVNPLITLPKDKSHPPKGTIYLTDVSISQVRLIDALPDLLDSNTALVRTSDILGSTPPSQFDQLNALAMDQSQQAAEVAALRRLGYTVPEHDSGALVELVATGSPASGHLNVGDTITALDATPVTTAGQLVSLLHSNRPGDQVQLTLVRRSRGSARTVTVKLGSRRVNGTTEPYLGVSVLTKASFMLPFPIEINSSGIGGPSAGLAFTLGIVNGLTSGDITGGKKVAATGTMDANGDVGDVGGVAQKTVAVKDAGATVFFVPPEELSVAHQHAGSGLQVIAVNSLDQTLSDLSRMGGNLSGVPGLPAKTGLSGLATRP